MEESKIKNMTSLAGVGNNEEEKGTAMTS